MTVTPYNFAKPALMAGRFEQDFTGWLKSACALAARVWNKQMSVVLQPQFVRCDFDRAQTATADLPEGSVGWRLVLHDRLHTLLVWPRPLVLGVLAALLGEAATALPAERELTTIDEALFEFFLKDFLLPPAVETWAGRLPLRPVVGAQEPNPRSSRLFAADDTVVTSRLLLRGPFGDHEWRWLFPKRGLMESLDREPEPAADASVQPRLEALVRSLPVEVTVILGAVQLRLSQLSDLRIGDVIVLDQRVAQPLTATIAGREKLCGWPGRLGNRQALQIEERQS